MGIGKWFLFAVERAGVWPRSEARLALSSKHPQGQQRDNIILNKILGAKCHVCEETFLEQGVVDPCSTPQSDQHNFDQNYWLLSPVVGIGVGLDMGHNFICILNTPTETNKDNISLTKVYGVKCHRWVSRKSLGASACA